MRIKTNERLKIVFLANSGWYFYNFRLNLINFLIEKNYDIHLICPPDIYVEKIKNKGIKVHTFKLDKYSTNLFKEIKSIFYIVRIYKKLNPFITHHFTIKGVIYGTIAAKLAGVKFIFNSITGLGRLFIGNSIKFKILNALIVPLYKFIIKKSNANLIFQNKEDLNFFDKLNISNKFNSFIIRGSGINTTKFKNKKINKYYPKDKYWKLLFPARLIKEKGIYELIKACDKLWEDNQNFRLYIATELNHHQKGNIKHQDFNNILNKAYVDEIKYQEEMKLIYEKTDIVVLPSWREGLSRALLEAGSMELPIITSNVPGCRDIVIHEETGLLVNREDPKSIEKAIIRLMKNKELCKIYGKEARKHVIRNFTNKIINQETLDLYQNLIREKK